MFVRNQDRNLSIYYVIGTFDTLSNIAFTNL